MALISSDDRQIELQRQVPDVVDLTVVAVESGMGIDGALHTVAQRMGGPLGEELLRTSEQVQQGTSARDAWLGLATRLNIPEFTQFISTLLQAREQGMSVGDTLRQKAVEIRDMRLQAARAEAAKIPIRMTTFNVFFVPCLVLAIMFMAVIPTIWVFLLLCVAGATIAFVYVTTTPNKEQERMEEQLATAATNMGAHLRAGRGFQQALAQVSQDLGPPLGPQLKRVSNDMNDGMDLVPAVEGLARRIPSREINLMVTGVVLQHRGQGALADILDRVSNIVRDRLRVRRELHALSTQPLLTARILIVLPLLVTLVMRVLQFSPHQKGLIDIGQFLPYWFVCGIVLGVFFVQFCLYQAVVRLTRSIERYMP